MDRQELLNKTGESWGCLACRVVTTTSCPASAYVVIGCFTLPERRLHSAARYHIQYRQNLNESIEVFHFCFSVFLGTSYLLLAHEEHLRTVWERASWLECCLKWQHADTSLIRVSPVFDILHLKPCSQLLAHGPKAVGLKRSSLRCVKTLLRAGKHRGSLGELLLALCRRLWK